MGFFGKIKSAARKVGGAAKRTVSTARKVGSAARKVGGVASRVASNPYVKAGFGSFGIPVGAFGGVKAAYRDVSKVAKTVNTQVKAAKRTASSVRRNATTLRRTFTGAPARPTDASSAVSGLLNGGYRRVSGSRPSPGARVTTSLPSGARPSVASPAARIDVNAANDAAREIAGARKGIPKNVLIGGAILGALLLLKK
jgi:hypothetical protein